jgi:hypothetical protein
MVRFVPLRHQVEVDPGSGESIVPAVYDNWGIHFLYPDNWTVDETESEGEKSVTVQSPGGAFWSITLHERQADPALLATAALEALQVEYHDSEFEAVEDQVAGQTIVGFDFSFFYLDFTNTAVIRAFQMPSASCLLLCQAEDHELEELGKVFHAITTSLLAPS